MIDAFLQSTQLPNLHPAIVHFPIAALPFALGFEILGLVLVKRRWLAHAATSLYAVAGVAAWLAVWAGERAADGLSNVPPQVQFHIAEHSDWGHYALYSLLALAVLRVGVHLAGKRADHRGARLAVLLLGLAAFGVLAKAADLGGGLVYRHGVATPSMPATEPGTEPAAVDVESPGSDQATVDDSAAAQAPESDPRERLVQSGDGGLVWQPAPEDRSAVGEVLVAAPGSSLDVVRWVSTEATSGLTLDLDGAVTLLLPGSFSDVQVEATLELVDWQGAVGVVHHLLGTQNRGTFTVSSEGFGVLADVRDAQRKVLDQKAASLPDSQFTVAVSSAGKHLKGLLNGDTVTHGHIEAGPAGSCGLIFEGKGRLRIVEVKVIPLHHG